MSAEIDRKRQKLSHFSFHDPINKTYKEAFKVTCPVHEEIKDSQIKLKEKHSKNGKKYNSSRNTETSAYNVGDNVFAYIPKSDRHSTHVQRFPFVVISKGGGKQLSYKLLTEFWILQKRYTAAKLLPYPGSIKCGDPSVRIGWAGITRKVVLAKRISFHSKGVCTTLAFRYKKARMKNSSQGRGVFYE